MFLTPTTIPHPDDPIKLHFAPQGCRERLKFALLGRPLIWSELRRAGHLPTPLCGPQRFQMQQLFSRHLLGHLQVKLELRGLEHLGPDAAISRPYLIAALHEGIADVLCLLQLPLPMRFVARQEIFGWPEVGPAITRLGHVAINPEHPLGGFRELWRRADEILAGGESLAIFPQGTVIGIQSDFQRGVFELARRLSAPILPVAISGSHRVWEHPFSPTLRYGQRVALTVLPPISAEEVRTSDLDALRIRTRRAAKAAALAPGRPPARFFEPDRDGYWDGYQLDIDPDFPELARKMAEHRAALLPDSA
ncbi:lysophospholipid acyltransferase family protein [Deinococcus alpinitundrae]|uniref:lysophospholipid acyltransferase family protein n=1 Tax=Deinococcus alpinitundrae TaxID=468913 RepID=UPI001ED94520|nr:lysophospholipid acyltransferase family protein [Deinococcus alpinitundrae]